MTTPPALSIAEQFPIRDARFTNGRTHHRTRRPVDGRWYEDPLEAACGKTGFLARGFPNGAIRDCPECARAIAADQTDTEPVRNCA
ncbi:hypothetical protein [Streptomyces sp. NPDC059916]|uniref:hypothetical protein n=1 Tax=Streptomyces sp. NPDC059916 TaxID=3347001 RepID=UPI0036CBFA80